MERAALEVKARPAAAGYWTRRYSRPDSCRVVKVIEPVSNHLSRT
jgi:hypothetical protein